MKRLVSAAVLAIMVFNVNVFAGGFQTVPEKEVQVHSQGLNVRVGPSINHESIREAKEGEILKVLGKIEDWYLIEMADRTVGLVYEEYVTVTKIEEEVKEVFEGDNESAVQGEGEEGIIFNLANESRFENGIENFVWDENLNKIAKLKAEDMLYNDYFDHYSEKYGTPFKMLKQMGVEYISAGENLAMTSALPNAHARLMASPAHRQNILSRRFNKMGVGVCKDNKGGYIIVQLFVEE